MHMLATVFDGHHVHIYVACENLLTSITQHTLISTNNNNNMNKNFWRRINQRINIQNDENERRHGR